MAKNKQNGKGIFLLGVAAIVAILIYGPAKELWTESSNDIRNEEVIRKIESAISSEREKTEENKEEKPAAAAKTPAAVTEGVEIPAPLDDRPEIILKKKGYTVSFNKELNIPNWVAWVLTPDRLVKNESRTNKFLPDPELDPAIAVTTDDYKGSGYDRGHMCPAGDNTWHWKAMQESFYMTNMCPQHGNLNRGDWKELEEACREWAQRDKKIYIVCGPILYKGKHKTIGREHKVVVPEAFYKVILCLESNPQKAIGFVYKNTKGDRPLDAYVNSVDEVERITGIDFFPSLPDSLENALESQKRLSLWRR